MENKEKELEGKKAPVKAKTDKVMIKSDLGATLKYNGITICAGETISLDADVAKMLVDKKYCSYVNVKGM